jgi:hypothetical protein
VAAFEAVEKAVVARNKPRVDAKTTLLSRFELLITFNSFDLTVPDLMGTRSITLGYLFTAICPHIL